MLAFKEHIVSEYELLKGQQHDGGREGIPGQGAERRTRGEEEAEWVWVMTIVIFVLYEVANSHAFGSVPSDHAGLTSRKV